MKKTIQDYLNAGFDLVMAKYYASGRKRIVNVVANDDFTLTLTFDNDEKRLFDMRSLLQKGTVFEPFLEIDNFKRVFLDDSHVVCWDIDPNVDSNVVWSNRVDICPDSCYVDSVPI